MNVFALDIHEYNHTQFYFLEPTPNIIIPGTFSKVIYTGYDFTMNGIYIYVPLDSSNDLNLLETQLLTQYEKHTNRPKTQTLGVKTNRLNHSKKMLLNISGVWENETHIGLTYKWIDGLIV
jgi:hypothetical protein